MHDVLLYHGRNAERLAQLHHFAVESSLAAQLPKDGLWLAGKERMKKKMETRGFRV